MPRTPKTTVTTKPKKRTYIPRQRPYTVSGRGGYWDNVRSRWNKGGGPMKGVFKQAGHLVGGPIGAQVGGLINRGLYSLTGFGDYQINSNSLIETNGPPTIVNRSNKEFVVRHREYIQDIYSLNGSNNTPSGFGIQGYPINPGSSTTFPWLSNIADKFEQYRIEGIIFEYKSLYSDAVVTQNGSIGSIILATDYNAGAPLFQSKQAMENYQFAQSSKPSNSIIHPIECARSQNVLSELYIRSGAVPSGEDIKTYDFGEFQIASQGIPLGGSGARVPLGELWVSYQIALLKPRLPPSSSAYVDSGFAYFTSVADNAAFVPWGTVPVPFNRVVRDNSLSNFNIYLISDNKFTIKKGSVAQNYQFDLYWYSAVKATTDVWRSPSPTITGGTIVNSSAMGKFQIVRIPNTASQGFGTNCHFLLNVPAALPGDDLCIIEISPGTFQADPTNGTRFEGYINAVPILQLP